MKDYQNNAVVADFIKAASANGQRVDNTLVGNNGMEPGATFTATGVVKVHDYDINGKKVSSIVIETVEDVLLPVKSIMGLSSMNGYQTEGTFEHQLKAEDGTKVTKQVAAKVVPTFDFNKAYNPATRGWLEHSAELNTPTASGKMPLEGAKLTYLGTVVRPIVATKASAPTSIEQYEAGYSRTITAKLWQIDGMNK